jgi:hypothetical protein
MSNGNPNDSCATALEPPALTPEAVQNAYDFAAFLLQMLWLLRAAAVHPGATDPIGVIRMLTHFMPQVLDWFAGTVVVIRPLLPLHQTWLGTKVEANSISLVLRLIRDTAEAITTTGHDFPPGPNDEFTPEFISAFSERFAVVMPEFPPALADTLRLENLQALQALQVTSLATSAPATSLADANNKQATHSIDFRSVNWFGTPYTFSANQAACVKVLWEHWEKGTPDVGGKTLLTVAESDAERIDLVFRGSPAWNAMIVKGGKRGTRRLQEPARAESDT